MCCCLLGPKIFKKSRGYESNDEIYTTPPLLLLLNSRSMIRKKSWVIGHAKINCIARSFRVWNKVLERYCNTIRRHECNFFRIRLKSIFGLLASKPKTIARGGN